MPSSPNYVRDYDQEYKTSKARGEVGTGGSSPNAKRKSARRAALKLGMVKPGQDVDHKKPLSKGGSNSVKNLKATSPSKNRSFPRKSDGSMK
jgi:5-methylcytosine-specific restriction endonuclease McrA